MKIALVAPLVESVPPLTNAPANAYVFNLAEALVRERHTVTLFASGDSTSSAKLVPSSEMALARKEHLRKTLPYTTLQVEQVLQRASEFDLIHWHLDYLPNSISRRLSTPALSTLHGNLHIPDLVSLYREFSDIPLVSVSDRQREPIVGAHWLGTVRPGLVPERWPLYPGSGNCIAYLGNLSPHSGIEIALALAERAGIPLKIGGRIDSDNQAYYDEVIRLRLHSRRVEYVGEVLERDKPEFLGNAVAALYFPHPDEPAGQTVIESLACGTPVIAFPGGPVLELMQDGVSGFLVQNQAEAGTALGQLGSLSRERCRAYFLERFSSETMARAYARLYRLAQQEKLESSPFGTIRPQNPAPNDSPTK